MVQMESSITMENQLQCLQLFSKEETKAIPIEIIHLSQEMLREDIMGDHQEKDHIMEEIKLILMTCQYTKTGYPK